MQKIKLILADDHALVREGFKSILNKSELFDIVGEAQNGKELLAQLEKHETDVALVDISMPELTGLEVIERYSHQFPLVKFIILTMHEEQEYVARGFKAGAHGYLLKNSDKTELEKAIQTVHEGGRYISPGVLDILTNMVTKPLAHDQVELTPREREVLRLVADGHSTKQVADKLSISIRTVESHRINMLKKMEVNNTAELIKKSIQLSLI